MSTEIQVDDETRAALLLFNERLEASAAEARAAKRVAKAEQAKNEAAAIVRKLNDDPKASAENKAEAEAAYKTAVDNFQIIKADPTAGLDEPKKQTPPDDEKPDKASANEALTADDTTSLGDDTSEDEVEASDDAPLAEVSADDEPAMSSESPADGEGE